MNLKPSKKFVSLILLIISCACSLSDILNSASQPQATPDLLSTVVKNLAETADIQTAIAQGIIGTLGSNVQEPPTDSSEKPLVSVSQLTNCRSGPGSSYEWLGSLEVGEQAEVFAQDPANTSWYIRNPDDPSGFCWIYGAFSTIDEYSSTIPVFTAIPSPTPILTATPIHTATPVGDFSVVVYGVSKCGGQYSVIRFGITNTGGITWQSWQIRITDTTKAVTKSYKQDRFFDFINCYESSIQADLTPGESGHANIGLFDYITIGHAMETEIKVCSQDGLGGTCITKNLNFKP